MPTVSSNRRRMVHDRPINPQGNYVLYWMIAFRRARSNFSLQRAVELATEMNKPLVVFEALRAGYEWASDRLHHFVIQGMSDNQAAFVGQPVYYYPYLEKQAGQGRGLVAELAKDACAVVSDDFPSFFLPRMITAAAEQIPVRFELVDSNGLFPMRQTDRVFARAYDFRRYLQNNLLPFLTEMPDSQPLKGKQLPLLKGLPDDILNRWPPADVLQLAANHGGLLDFSIDHSVAASTIQGGSVAARNRLQTFLTCGLDDYGDLRNEPTQDVTSGLSPFLHFGHISAHEVFQALVDQERWTVDLVAEKANGSSTGWWGTRGCVESFLDELITWRELGFNMCSHREDYDRYESLPDWARLTLREHELDRRPYLYSLDEFASSETHDPLWNAAQRQLVREGRMHNYLRMLWGKKILEWTVHARDALAIMIELNNKYALDGRNPNSYSGIFWVLGRYDRAWGPERPIFGKIRYMSSDNTARKVRVKPYLEKYGQQSQLF